MVSKHGDSTTKGGNAEPFGEGLAGVGEGFAEAEVFRTGEVLAEKEDGDLLAGVVGAGPGRVVAVVGGEAQEIAVAQFGQKLGQAGIEFFEGAAVADGVATVAKDGVEIDEVCHDKPAFSTAVE